jgi:hypothetical protein
VGCPRSLGEGCDTGWSERVSTTVCIARRQALSVRLTLEPHRRFRKLWLWVALNVAGAGLYLVVASGLWLRPGEEGLPGGPGDAFYFFFSVFPILVALLRDQPRCAWMDHLQGEGAGSTPRLRPVDGGRRVVAGRCGLRPSPDGAVHRRTVRSGGTEGGTRLGRSRRARPPPPNGPSRWRGLRDQSGGRPGRARSPGERRSATRSRSGQALLGCARDGNGRHHRSARLPR